MAPPSPHLSSSFLLLSFLPRTWCNELNAAWPLNRGSLYSIYTSEQNNKIATQSPTPTHIPTPFTQPSTTMANIKCNYKEQHQSKNKQYRVLTCDLIHHLLYLSQHNQEAIGLDSLGSNPMTTKVDTYIRWHLGLNPNSMTIQQQIHIMLDDNAPPFETIGQHPTPYHSPFPDPPSPNPIPIPPWLNDISPTCSELGDKLWEETHFPEGFTFLHKETPSPCSSTPSSNPLAEFPHTPPFATPYNTSDVSDKENWGEVQCIPSPDISKHH